MPDASKDAAKPASAAARDYKETLFLPSTDFPMRAGLPQREPDFLKRWEAMDLYRRLREEAKDRQPYVLHDGPPYANGHVHMGTALTKVLKDMIVRSRQMAGFDANYVPGWDCHGLPIEWKVEEEFRAKGRAKRDIPSSEFRAQCRAYAQKWLDIQREEFRRLGVTGDWENPYTTMAFESEAVIAEELLKFVRNGLLYRGSKPVMWSPVEQTALAEAEIEYHDKVSPTVWVKFPVSGIQYRTPPGRPNPFPRRPASVVIWTTTPWTIPGNRAICYGRNITYGLYKVNAVDSSDFQPWASVGEKLIVADQRWESVASAAKISEWERLGAVDPSNIQTCQHPLRGFHGGYYFPVPMFHGDHVTDEDGTGFVHIAPGHGQEDYQVWIENTRRPIVTTLGEILTAAREAENELEKISNEIPHTVDEFGRFTNEAPGFEGKEIIRLEGKKAGQDGDANKAVIDALIERGMLLARGRLTHSYPHSWRSKAPVIFRNTPQWFIALDKPIDGGKTLRKTALAAIDETGFTPPGGKNRLRSMVETRPDWLVSRQRAWGVPLPIFVEKKTGEILRDEDVNARVIAMIREKGADAWFDMPAEELLGPAHDAAEYEKVEDILDVWFDSGSTHAFTLEGRDDLVWPADVYCEGSDQHRGWFQSSLLESCGTRGRAPYRHVVTNGFVVDAEGRKMSKSLGNVVAPDAVIKEYGAEIIRIWVASSDYTDDLRIGPEIIGSAVDSYRKLRNTLRYLLGALAGYSDAESLPAREMPELERYVLHLAAELDHDVRAAYEAFDFKRVWRKVFDFCSLDLSAFYLDIRKDSLYCDRPDAPRRRAARTAMDLLFERIVRWLAPVCVFTAEEAWLARNPGRKGSVHLELFPETPKDWIDAPLAEKWERIREVRRVVTGALENERREKRIGASLEASPTIYIADAGLRALCESVDFAEIAITSGIVLQAGEGPAAGFRLPETPGVVVEPLRALARKCVRCWRYVGDVGEDDAHAELCGRCAEAVRGHDRDCAGAA